jgi:hypothetical protein
MHKKVLCIFFSKLNTIFIMTTVTSQSMLLSTYVHDKIISCDEILFVIFINVVVVVQKSLREWFSTFPVFLSPSSSGSNSPRKNIPEPHTKDCLKKLALNPICIHACKTNLKILSNNLLQYCSCWLINVLKILIKK